MFIRGLGIDGSWAVHCWEPNPENHPEPGSLPCGAIFHQEAVWDQNEKVVLRQDEQSGGFGGQGSTVMPDVATDPERKGWLPDLRGAEVEVDGIDFALWVLNETDPSDEVYIKMDIEGAEFPVVRRMLELEDALPGAGIFGRIKTMWIEWHDRFFETESEATAQALEAQLSKLTSVRKHL
jgi:hypothetical protein